MNLYKKHSFSINILLVYIFIIFITLKLSLIWMIVLVTFLFVGISVLFYRYDKQKHYYKSIIDNSTNIVIVSDTNKLVSANRTFFTYFHDYKNIEEFIAILLDTTKDKAYLLAQKLRENVQNHKEILPITMSFGVAEYEKGDDDISLYKRVDVALYKAKETGRNKVVLG